MRVQRALPIKLAVTIVALLLFLFSPISTRTSFSRLKPATATYVLDNQKGKFIAHAFAGGLLWFKGHDHYLAARDFSGEVELTPDSITPASLRLTVKSASLEETGTVFTEEQKKIINKEVHDIVLLPEKYPEITFQSKRVEKKGKNFLAIGDFSMHGVTKEIAIPFTVTGKFVNPDNQQMSTGFSANLTINRRDYGINWKNPKVPNFVGDLVNIELAILVRTPAPK